MLGNKPMRMASLSLEASTLALECGPGIDAWARAGELAADDMAALVQLWEEPAGLTVDRSS